MYKFFAIAKMSVDLLNTSPADMDDDNKSEDSWQMIEGLISGDSLTTQVAEVTAGESKEKDIVLEPENDSVNDITQISSPLKLIAPDDPYFSLENISNPMVVGASNQIVIIRGVDSNGNVIYRLARRVENGKAVLDLESVIPYQYEEFRRGEIDVAGMLDEFLEIAVLNLSDCLNIQLELNKNSELKRIKIIYKRVVDKESGIERINISNVSPDLLQQISKLLRDGAAIEALPSSNNSEVIRFSNLARIVINSPITEDDWKLICKLAPSNQLIDLLNHPHPNVFFDENGVMQDAIVPRTLPSLNLGVLALRNGVHPNFLDIKIPMIEVTPLVSLSDFKFPIRRNEKKGPKVSYPKSIRDSQGVMIKPEIYLSPDTIKLVVLQSQEGRVNTRILEHNLKALADFGGSILFDDGVISHVAADLALPFSDSRTKFIFKNHIDAKNFGKNNPTLKVFVIDSDGAVIELERHKKPLKYFIPLSKLASALGLI